MQTLSSHRRLSRTVFFPSLGVFKFEAILFRDRIFSPVLRILEKTLIDAIKSGVTAEAAIGGVIKMIDSIVNHNLVLLRKWSP